MQRSSEGVWSIVADGRIRLRISAVPGASRTGLAEIRADSLRVRLAAAPEKGKANDELIEWLAEVLHVRRSALSIETGATSRIKTVLAPADCLAAVQNLVGGT